MFKTLFISLNILGLAIIPILYVGKITVDHTATQSEMEAGEDIEVTITLNKGSVTGPARLKINFEDAEGLVPEEIDNAGASFSYSDGEALLIWYSIPGTETITIKYRIKADAMASGTKTVGGTFSYLDESERKKIDIPSIIITVNDGGAVANNTSENNNTSTEEENTTSETASNENTEGNETASASIDDVVCNRTITEDGEGYLVTINVTKGANGGFARIKDVVPAGFTAEAIEKSGSVFKFVDGYAKFLWTSLKKDEETVTVSYSITPSSAGAGTYSVSGQFSGEFLILNDVPTSVDIPAASFNYAGNEMASNNTSENNTTNDPNNGENNTSENNNTDTNNTDTNNTNTNTNTNTNDTNTTIPSNSSITYKVQVLAAHKNVSSSYLKRHYNGFTSKVEIENHEGWIKYTTGKFNVYKDARDKRESLDSYDFPGQFVTAYNQGERITVQEALMITKQDWVK